MPCGTLGPCSQQSGNYPVPPSPEPSSWRWAPVLRPKTALCRDPSWFPPEDQSLTVILFSLIQKGLLLLGEGMLLKESTTCTPKIKAPRQWLSLQLNAGITGFVLMGKGQWWGRVWTPGWWDPGEGARWECGLVKGFKARSAASKVYPK